ncbi:hypothetical protein DRH13_02710 [Candidatus Woesebacteria bacterium]|nr:MAG: hypothetical protein DRH13_02710 [Candidatus Woesebacteria bacterium]
MQKEYREEKAENLRPKELQSYEEKLNFLKTRFITHAKSLIDPEQAEVTFGGDIFVGTKSLLDKKKLIDSLGVNIDNQPNFQLKGQFEFDVYLVPQSSPPLYVLKRETEEEIEILAYEGALLEIFEEAENLKRIGKA